MISSISIIIPCFNEESTIEQVIQKVLDVEIKDVSKEIIIIDDGSSDNTLIKINNYNKFEKVTLLKLEFLRLQMK